MDFRKIWFVDWWNATVTWQAKLLVIQAIAVKLVAIGAVITVIWLGYFVTDNAIAIILFRTLSDSMTINTDLRVPFVLLSFLAIALVLMVSLQA
jgi:hypothetical protein